MARGRKEQTLTLEKHGNNLLKFLNMNAVTNDLNGESKIPQ